MTPGRLIAPLIASSLSWVSAAVAQPQPHVLTWAAPSECPAEVALRAEVAAMVGERAATTTAVRVEARVSRPAPERWVVALSTRADGFSGDRTLEASTCRELGDAVVVILAWMIDPSTRPAAPAREPPRAARDRWRLRVALGARGDLGPLPAFAVGPELRVSVTRGRWRLFVDGSWRPTVRGALDASAGGDFHLWTVGLGACYRGSMRRLIPSVCAGAEGGRLSGAGYGVSRPDEGAQPWVAFTGGGALELALSARLSLSARASLEVPVVRPDFVLRGAGPVFQPSAVGLRTGIDAEVIF